jgi:NAD(P)-dependent dehydrogenase (short-subunit alcohol dehydrogenase family)
MANHMHLAGKRILVTGGTTGIGLATVELLADAGAHVLTFGRHDAGLRDVIATDVVTLRIEPLVQKIC